MVDLTDEMASLRASLAPVRAERARILLFVAATRGEGTSTVAREYARLAAAKSRRAVWLVDADLDAQRQLKAVDSEPDRYGELGEEAAASPDDSAFFTIEPPLLGRDGRVLPPARLASARPALGGRLWVTSLRRQVLDRDQAVKIDPSPDYWNALRKHSAEIVIDAPAADRSDAAIALAPLADLVVLVVAAEAAAPEAALVLRQGIEAAGGRVAGLVFNRADAAPPRLIRRFVS
jgi:hypothetical protein